MPHIRPRSMTKVIQKELSFWPVVCLLGPRQCGKSTLLRELLFDSENCTYRTLDSAGERSRAQNSPELYLGQVEKWPLIVDEAHKAPELFDEIKAKVDEKRRPGKFVLTGSVRFSTRVGIRESLTGRAAVLYLDPLTISETSHSPVTLNEVNRYLRNGGMPGVCFLRSEDKVQSYWEQWLDTICERDLNGVSKGRLSGTLARLIIEKSCELALPTAHAIAVDLSTDTRRINTHLKALQDLFVIREVIPSTLGIGKEIYLPFDSGLATHLKASLRRRWQSWFINETLNRSRFSGKAHAKLPNYYITSRRSMVDFVDEHGFHLFSDKAVPSRKDLMTVSALQKKISKQERIFIHCATDAEPFDIDKQIKVLGWKELCLKNRFL